MERIVLGITVRDKVPKAEIRRKTKLVDILEKVMSMK